MAGISLSGILLTAAIGAVCAAPADAQILLGSASAGGALITGGSNHSAAVQASGNVELGRGPLTFGVEIGVLHLPGVTETFNNGYSVSFTPSETDPFVSYKASYYPSWYSGHRLQPFVNGGLSAFKERSDGFPTLDVGGGADWWTKPRTGVRFEARAHSLTVWSFQVGVVFR